VLPANRADRVGRPVSARIRRLFEITGANLDPDFEIRSGGANG
jgi:hypothetical protein